MDHHTEGKWFIHGIKHRKEIQLPRKLLLIILSLVCKSDIKQVYGDLSNPFFKQVICKVAWNNCVAHNLLSSLTATPFWWKSDMIQMGRWNHAYVALVWYRNSNHIHRAIVSRERFYRWDTAPCKSVLCKTGSQDNITRGCHLAYYLMHKTGWRLSLTMFVANITLQWGCLKITLNSTLCPTAFPTDFKENIPEFSITGNFGEIQRRPEVPLPKGQSRVNFSMTEPIYFLKPYIHCMTGKPIVMHRRQVRHLNCEYVNKTKRSLCLTSWSQQPSVKW